MELKESESSSNIAAGKLEMSGKRAEYLEQLCQENANGFKYSQLDHVTEIVHDMHKYLLAASSGAGNVTGALCVLLKTLERPFVAEKSNEHVQATGHIVLLVSSIGKLLNLRGLEQVHLAVVCFLQTFARGGVQRNKKRVKEGESNLGAKATNRNNKYISQSKILSSTASFVSTLVDAKEAGTVSKLLRATIETVLDLSQIQENAYILAKCGTFMTLVRLLGSVSHFEDGIVAMVVEILTNLVNCLTMSGEFCIFENSEGNEDLVFDTLFSLLRSLLHSGYRRIDKELRNEVLVLLYMLKSEAAVMNGHDAFAKQRKDAYFTSKREMTFDNNDDSTLSVLSLALFCVCAKPNTTHSAIKSRVFNTSADEDFEFKSVAWDLVSVLVSENESTLRAVQDSPFLYISTTIDYLRESETAVKQGAILQYANAQLKVLQLQALSSLIFLAKHCAKEILELDGLRVLRTFVLSEIRNSDSDDEEKLEACLLVLVALCDRRDVARTLVQMGTFSTTMDIFACKEREFTSPVRELSLVLASKMCREQTSGGAEALRERGDLSVMIDCIRAWTESDDVSELLIAGSVNLLWTAIVGRPKMEAQFVRLDGVEALLDLMNGTTRLLRNEIVGCLADLAKSAPRAIHRMRIWRGTKSSESLSQRLVSYWRQEERRLGIFHDKKNVLKSLAYPLNEDATFKLQKNTPSSPSVTRSKLHRAISAGGDDAQKRILSQDNLIRFVHRKDVRYKIYALLKYVVFEADAKAVVPGNDGADDDGGATAVVDSIYLALIEKFELFSRSEVWNENMRDLGDSDVKAIAPDRARSAYEIEVGRKNAEEIRNAQSRRVEQIATAQQKEEEMFLDALRTRHEDAVEASGGK